MTVAVVATECDNGAGSADDQLAFGAIVYVTSQRRLRVVGIMTPRQPFGMVPHALLSEGSVSKRGASK